MIARVDGVTVPPAVLWRPAMNFGQFWWDQIIGRYELVIPRPEFVSRLADAYRQMVAELRADDCLDPEHRSSLKEAGYPPFEVLPDHPTAFLEAVQVYLWDDLLTAFVSPRPVTVPSFMVNSIEGCSASTGEVVIRGRGCHRPGSGS